VKILATMSFLSLKFSLFIQFEERKNSEKNRAKLLYEKKRLLK